MHTYLQNKSIAEGAVAILQMPKKENPLKRKYCLQQALWWHMLAIQTAPDVASKEYHSTIVTELEVELQCL